MKRFLLFLPIIIVVIPVYALAEEPILTIDTGGHMAKINEVIFTNDGKYVVSTSNDKTIRIWDVAEGELVRVLRGQIERGQGGKIYAAALSRDNRLLALGGWIGKKRNRWIRLMDFSTGQITALLKGHTNVIQDLAFSHDGSKLISGSSDRTARIWDLRTNKTLYVLKGHGKQVYSVSFSPDGSRAVTGSWDSLLMLWNAKTGKMISTLPGHKRRIMSAAFTPDGKYLLSGSADRTIRLWDGMTGNFIKVLATQKARVSSLSISSDGSRVLTGCSAGKITNNVFSIPAGKLLASFDRHNNTVMATAISPDGKVACTAGGNQNEIYLWDISTGRVKQKMKGKGKNIWNVSFSRDGSSIAWGKTLKRHDADIFRKGPLEQSFHIIQNDGAFSLSFGDELTDDSNYLGALRSAGRYSIRTKNDYLHPVLEIYKNGQKIHEIKRVMGRGSYHTAMTLTNDGKTVISGGANGYLASYDPSTGKEIRLFLGHTGDVWAVAASPDSRLLLSGGNDQVVRLWEIATGKLLLSIFQGSDNEWVAWVPEGYYTSSLHGDKYIGWHLNNGEAKPADYYSAFQFERILYRPDYVNAYLKYGGNREKVESFLGGKFFNINNIKKIEPPTINIISPFYGKLFHKESRIPIKFSVVSNSIDMLSYSVFVNNIPITPSAERILKGPDKRSFIKEIDIPLFDRKNKIRIEVLNGKSMGLAESVFYQKVSTAKKHRGDLYLLSIGVNDFANMPSNNLSFAASDAYNLAKFYRNKEGKSFRNIFTESISDLTDTKPLKDNILKSLEFIKRAKAEDTVMIFLASHGLSDPAGNYYFVPRDAVVRDVKKLTEASIRGTTGSMKNLSSLITWEAFFDVMRSVPGKRLLIVDTCQAKNISGTFDIHSLAKRSASSAFALLAASKGDEESQEYPKGKQGLFTFALLKGLSGDADSNRDGQVVLSEIYNFISKFVERNRDKNIGNQTPQLVAPKELKNIILSSH